jgi:hypothetical protein
MGIANPERVELVASYGERDELLEYSVLALATEAATGTYAGQRLIVQSTSGRMSPMATACFTSRDIAVVICTPEEA